MKRFIIPATLLFLTGLISLNSCNSGPAQAFVISDSALRFSVTGLTQAEALSKKENKTIFLFAHASYCGACKKMKKEVLSKKEVGDFFNKQFINSEVDIESPEGKELVKKYDIDATPTLLFLNADGGVIKKASGFHDEAGLIALAKNL